MPGKKYDTEYMDSPIERGAPYKMTGHTLPGIKQNPRTANMFAGEDGPFLQKKAHVRIVRNGEVIKGATPYEKFKRKVKKVVGKIKKSITEAAQYAGSGGTRIRRK